MVNLNEMIAHRKTALQVPGIEDAKEAFLTKASEEGIGDNGNLGLGRDSFVDLMDGLIDSALTQGAHEVDRPPKKPSIKDLSAAFILADAVCTLIINPTARAFCDDRLCNDQCADTLT